jgi:HEAT repeat protein
MEGLFLVALGGLLAAAVWLQIQGRIGRVLPPDGSTFRQSPWRTAARAAGLVRIEESAGALSGWAGRVHVSLSRYGGDSVYGTHFVLGGPGLASDLTVRPQGLGTTLRAAVGEREIEVGDEAFDRVAWIQGSPGLAHALLDRPTREAFRSLFGGYLSRPGKMPFFASASLDGGSLRIDVPEVLRMGEGQEGMFEVLVDALAGNERRERACLGRLERLPEVLEAVLAFARRLEPPADVAKRIAENLRDEPEPGVRARGLTALVREFPNHPATRKALLAACEDPDAEVRLRAATALGDQGRGVLVALAGGEGAEDATTAKAVTALGPRLDPAEARKLLGRALRTRRIATAQACMEILGRQRGRDAVRALARVLAVEKGELAVAAAVALGTTHDPSAEAPLIETLDSPSSALRHAAAWALGRTGTAAAVPHLKAAEARHSDLARAARQSIAEIQARLTGAEPGQLSLAAAEGEVGRLSLADADPAGRLTLAGKATEEPAVTKGAPGAPEPPAPAGAATPVEAVAIPESPRANVPRPPAAARARRRE